MKIGIVVNQTSAGHWRVRCPALPGCAVEAESPQAAQDGMRSAVAAYISSFDVAPPPVIDLVGAEEDGNWKPETGHAEPKSLG